jgi:hypothetical protein
MTAHWGIPDPAEAKGSPAQIALAFKDAYRMLFQRIGVFTALVPIVAATVTAGGTYLSERPVFKNHGNSP